MLCLVQLYANDINIRKRLNAVIADVMHCLRVLFHSMAFVYDLEVVCTKLNVSVYKPIQSSMTLTSAKKYK